MERFMQDCQNCFLRVQINVLRIFSKKFRFFSTFSENEQKAIQLLAEFFRHVFQKCIWSLQRNILRIFFEKIAFFSSLLDFILRNSSNIGGKSSASLSETHYRCQGEHFEKEQLFWTKNTCFFWLLLDFQPFFLEIRQKFSSRGVQTAFRVYRGRVWAENFFGKKNIFLLMFVTLETKNWEFWQKHVCRVVKTVFYVARGTLWGLFWRRYTSSRRFRNMNKKLSNFWRKYLGKLV